jgi:alpha-beta hydrolase superfamily lysophospholipase
VVADPETRNIRAGDGRQLCARVGEGDSERCVLVMHGTPGSGSLYRGWVEDAASRGIRLVSYDRPGYGVVKPASRTLDR